MIKSKDTGQGWRGHIRYNDQIHSHSHPSGFVYFLQTVTKEGLPGCLGTFKFNSAIHPSQNGFKPMYSWVLKKSGDVCCRCYYLLLFIFWHPWIVCASCISYPRRASQASFHLSSLPPHHHNLCDLSFSLSGSFSHRTCLSWQTALGKLSNPVLREACQSLA